MYIIHVVFNYLGVQNQIFMYIYVSYERSTQLQYCMRDKQIDVLKM